MWTLFIHATWFVTIPVSSNPKYTFLFINDDLNGAEKIVSEKQLGNLSQYIYVSNSSMNDLWQDAINIPGFHNPNMTLAEAIVRPDTYVLNITKTQDSRISCISCGFVNTYADFNTDPKTYKCYKCITGW